MFLYEEAEAMGSLRRISVIYATRRHNGDGAYIFKRTGDGRLSVAFI